jgi:phage/plasmid-like protein (TIGR03299 family)
MKSTTWRNLGTEVQANNIADVMVQAGLNYEVVLNPLQTTGGILVPDSYASMTKDGSHIFGVVGSKYNPVQNTEAFSFIDEMIPSGLIFEKAGQTRHGLVYIIASLPEYKLFGDKMKTYIIFQNSHNGMIPLKAAITPLRLVCENQFNYAFKGASNTVKIRHTTSAQQRLGEAQRVMSQTQDYTFQFQTLAHDLLGVRLTAAQVKSLIDRILPLEKDAAEKKAQTVIEMRENMYGIYTNEPDLQNFRGTGWGLANAYTDFMTHSEPQRKAEGWQDNRFAYLLNLDMGDVIDMIAAA